MNENEEKVIEVKEAGAQIQEITDDDFLEGKETPTVEYIRRVRGHVEICPIKKLEIIH